MHRKYKKQIIGINPKWVEIYILKPMSIIIILGLFIAMGIMRFKAYAIEQAEIESERAIAEAQEAAVRESIAAVELQAQLKQDEEERIKESEKAVAVERQRTNTLYENEVSKKIAPIGTYLRNNTNKKVGRVVGYYGLEIITNNEWNFTLDPEKTELPEDITMIGYAEYTRKLKAQKEREEKLNRLANANQIQKLIDEEIARQTAETREKLNTGYFELDGTKYRIVDIKGTEITVIKQRERKQRKNYKTMEYSDKMKSIPYRDFERLS